MAYSDFVRANIHSDKLDGQDACPIHPDFAVYVKDGKPAPRECEICGEFEGYWGCKKCIDNRPLKSCLMCKRNCCEDCYDESSKFCKQCREKYYPSEEEIKKNRLESEYIKFRNEYYEHDDDSKSDDNESYSTRCPKHPEEYVYCEFGELKTVDCELCGTVIRYGDCFKCRMTVPVFRCSGCDKICCSDCIDDRRRLCKDCQKEEEEERKALSCDEEPGEQTFFDFDFGYEYDHESDVSSEDGGGDSSGGTQSTLSEWM